MERRLIMENSIQKFDPTTAMVTIKEQIKNTFASLIPEEQWEAMVKKEIDSYFEEKAEVYDTRGRSSTFTKDVHTLLAEEVKSRTKVYLTGPDFQTTWVHNGISTCNIKVEEMITKNAGKILADMIGGTISMALNNAGYRM